MSNEKKYGLETKPKKKRFTCKSFIETFYDKEDKTIFSRTCKDWAYLLIFFIFFYAVLFGYFALLIYIFINGIMTKNVPFRTGSNSLIGAKSSLSFRPVMSNGNNILALSLNSSSTSYGTYVNQTHGFLNSTLQDRKGNVRNCNTSLDGSTDQNVCFFDRSSLGPCANIESELRLQRMCIYLRINNIFGWVPNVQNANVTSNILVSCTGQNPTDTANIGSLRYYPNTTTTNVTFGSFPSYYYPYLNQTNYWPPIVAVEFQNITMNTVVYVKCSVLNVDNISGSTSLVVLVSNIS